MKIHKVSLTSIKTDPLAHELGTSEETKPYLDCLIRAYRNDAVGFEASLAVVRDLPLEKRYTWRVFSALKWAFADFEDEYIALDLPHIPEPTRSDLTKELELRVQQLQILLQTFQTERRLTAMNGACNICHKRNAYTTKPTETAIANPQVK